MGKPIKLKSRVKKSKSTKRPKSSTVTETSRTKKSVSKAKKAGAKKTSRRRLSSKSIKSKPIKKSIKSSPSVSGKYELIIAEKPKAAYKIAVALSDKTPEKNNYKGVPYYRITINGKPAVVASAVGHLYTLMERGGNKWKYPVFDVEWAPTFKVNKKAQYVRKYVELLKKLGKKASSFVIATDYDIEGEVIGLNVLKFALGAKDGYRMKFSTLTPSDLRKSYAERTKTIDWSQANAGVTRHMLDYYYGINVSRALTSSLKTAGMFKVLSSGRVQGPALKIVVDRCNEIKSFVPKKYWQVFLKVQKIDAKSVPDVDKGTESNNLIIALHEKNKFWDKTEAEKTREKAMSGQPFVESITSTKTKVYPPVPFDLTTLQTEAFRCFRIKPKRTLEIAQELYTDGLISYPRTSSQKLPYALGFKNLIKKLSQQAKYSQLANKLLKKKSLTPREGKKTDPAHPSIYPTGFKPKNLGDEQLKVYDLIVKRFLCVFAEPADKLSVKAIINSNDEKFGIDGVKIDFPGWIDFYKPYAYLKEKEIPSLNENEKLTFVDVEIVEKETQPKPHYTQASLIRELTKRNLGTKATRAQVIDTLFKRGYLRGEKVEATELGEAAIKTLLSYSPTLLDEGLTRHFEDELENVRQGKKEKEEVINEAEKVVQKIVDDFKKNEKSIGSDLRKAHKETRAYETVIGKCPVCKIGDLVIRRSKKTGKRFIACNRYPACKTTFPLPQYGLVKPAHENCPSCGWPMVLIIRKGKRPWKLCFNPDCPGKKKKEQEGNAGTEKTE